MRKICRDCWDYHDEGKCLVKGNVEPSKPSLEEEVPAAPVVDADTEPKPEPKSPAKKRAAKVAIDKEDEE